MSDTISLFSLSKTKPPGKEVENRCEDTCPRQRVLGLASQRASETPKKAMIQTGGCHYIHMQEVERG